jgi:hypothetical protein
MARKGGARRMRLNTVEIAVPIQDNPIPLWKPSLNRILCAILKIGASRVSRSNFNGLTGQQPRLLLATVFEFF